ncbi:MAG: knotted carbamoyltransferase YgeW [Gemmatimonadota bacterium]|nr:knotted carbamoyltransferase YgeW [Gemmatimonadota bacterium]
MTHNDIRPLIGSMETLENRLHDGDFLRTWDVDDDSLGSVLLGAEILRDLHRANISARFFDTGLALSIFRDKSTRTRYSFRSGANLLGLMTEELDEGTSQIAHGETVRETATMISFLTETIGIRDDMFLGEGHAYMKEVAEAVEESRREGVLAQRPSVINLQCDLDHPTQSLSDLRHLMETFGGLDELRGKRIAMTWAYSPSYGKPLSVPQGVVSLMTRFGMDVVLAHPEGYGLVEEPLDAARRGAAANGGAFSVVHSMDEAFEGADIVYPKSWAPVRVMHERTRLLRAGETNALKELERECLAENARFQDWECTEEKMARTKNGQASYMHCLPADITGVSCESGEVSESVFEKARLGTYQEAAHKPFVIASMILHTRFADPAAALGRCLDRGIVRR